MPDYQQMYFALFNSVTDAVMVLQQAQQNAEDTYINNDGTMLSIVQEPDTTKEQRMKNGGKV